jgi:hypothetical protein
MNIPGDYVNSLAAVKESLIRQVPGTVRWEKGIRAIQDVARNGKTNRVDAEIFLCALYRRDRHRICANRAGLSFQPLDRWQRDLGRERQILLLPAQQHATGSNLLARKHLHDAFDII